MQKSVIAPVMAIVVALTCLMGLTGRERKSMDYSKPSVTRIDSGEINNIIGLDMSKKLNESNGKYVNLYVENNGSNSVVATINEQDGKTFEAGEKDYIYLEVTQDFLGLDREYVFKVVPGTNGGSVNIHYEIAQDVCYYFKDTSR